MNISDLSQLLSQVSHLVRQAASLCSRPTLVKSKGKNDFVTEADRCISDFFLESLPELLPGSQVLSEEANPEKSLNSDFIWVVDPIDGTTNYIFNLPLFCISVGLLQNGNPVLGAVYNPADHEFYTACLGGPALLNGKPIQVNSNSRLSDTLLLAETNPYSNRQETQSMKVLASLFPQVVDLRITGSAALDLCYVSAGRAGVFVAERISPWDSAAGLAILAQAGGKATRWNGDGFDLRPGTLLATNGKLHTQSLAAIQHIYTKGQTHEN